MNFDDKKNRDLENLRSEIQSLQFHLREIQEIILLMQGDLKLTKNGVEFTHDLDL